MSGSSHPGRYETVVEAEEDIGTRLSNLPGSDRWLTMGLPEAVVPTWTEALTSFSANCEVTPEESASLEQIKASYEAVSDELEARAALIGSGTMDTLEPGHTLFMVLFRELQYEIIDRANMNPHKLRVLLDGRYSVR